MSQFVAASCSLIAFSLLFSGGQLMAQQAVNTSGGEASGTSGSLSYSVGQICFTTVESTSGSLAQGVQISVEEVDDQSGFESNQLLANLKVYPNPVSDFLVVQLTNQQTDLSELSYMLYSVDGKLLKTSALPDAETEIDLGDLSSGNYFFKLISNNQVIKTFKISKR